MTVFGDSSYFLLFFDVVVAMISESVLRESVQRSICVSGHVAACDTATCHVAAFLLFFDVVVAFLFFPQLLPVTKSCDSSLRQQPVMLQPFYFSSALSLLSFPTAIRTFGPFLRIRDTQNMAVQFHSFVSVLDLFRFHASIVETYLREDSHDAERKKKVISLA